jgi:4,5-dihydroxyphthalate decarboxylase
VKPSDIHWIRGGIEHPGRPEKISIQLPKGVRLEEAPEGKTISDLLAEGKIDGFMAPRPPPSHRRISAGCSAIRLQPRRIIMRAVA